MTKPNLGVLGAGLMGGGIALDAARHGIEVVVYDARADAVEKLKARAAKTYERWVSSNRMTTDDAQSALARIIGARDLGEAGTRDIIIEAVFEDLAVKRALFADLAPHIARGSIVATNTSALKVGDIADVLPDPARFLGLHYFSPAEVSPLVEVVRAERTSAETVARALAFLEQTRRVPLRCSDTPGFVVNRFFCPYYNEAAHIVQDLRATASEVDFVARERLGIAAGPFKVMNLIGATVAAHAMENLSPLGPFYRACAALVRQGESGAAWEVSDMAAPSSEVADEIEQRLLGALFVPALELLNAGASTPADMDKGAQLALRFTLGPCALMERAGTTRVQTAVARLCARDGHPQPALFDLQPNRAGRAS
ncbi:3-hydroxyacyl-CoA dehydrogenase [Roseixanthobacter pseudopolyaromaticivorans]|uniref:3-hydroxyacyl-CoA dehydrogenase n=1 Tax=Xanthobacteraceae TaxID=335928 RepID=UPI003729A9EE